MSGLDDERLNAIRNDLPAHYFDCDRFNVSHSGQHGKCDCTATVDVTAVIESLAAVSADRDREAERADKAEALLTNYAIAHEQTVDAQIAALDAIDAWYTDAAMRAGQQ